MRPRSLEEVAREFLEWGEPFAADVEELCRAGDKPCFFCLHKELREALAEREKTGKWTVIAQTSEMTTYPSEEAKPCHICDHEEHKKESAGRVSRVDEISSTGGIRSYVYVNPPYINGR